MTKIEIVRDCKWSIDYKVVEFEKGQIFEVINDIPASVADAMMKYGYAQKIQSKRTKATLVEENKAVESGKENKISIGSASIELKEESKRRGRPRKNNILTLDSETLDKT